MKSLFIAIVLTVTASNSVLAFMPPKVNKKDSDYPKLCKLVQTSPHSKRVLVCKKGKKPSNPKPYRTRATSHTTYND